MEDSRTPDIGSALPETAFDENSPAEAPPLRVNSQGNDTATPASASGQQTNDRAQRRDEATATSEAPREASADSDKDQSPR